jgi:tetratricopeptide (TPR) repeat protein
MPETAKILPFRARATAVPSTREDAFARGKAFLEIRLSDRTEECVDASLSDGDVLTSIFSLLWDLINSSPSVVAEEAPAIYKWLSARPENDFFFDERDFFLGESALLAAGSLRLLGKREETERWLDRADAGFRHTVAPTAHLARVSYIRLTLRYDMRRHEDLLELVPSVALTFQKLGMGNDLAKCRFLEAMSLKELGRIDEAVNRLERLVSGNECTAGAGLTGMALVNLGDLRSTQGLYEAALEAYAKAAPLLHSEKRFSAIADLKLMIAVTLRRIGHREASLAAYREAIKGHADLGMSTRVAYERVLFAEALIEAGRVREAEWEILAALPTISEQKMVPEGFAAVSLLRESVRQRRTDPKALLDLREYLQAQN